MQPRAKFTCELGSCKAALSFDVTHMIVCGHVFRFCNRDHMDEFKFAHMSVVAVPAEQARRKFRQMEDSDGA